MNDVIRYALEKALRAPSGENCQPWRFIVKGETVELWNRPERDTSPYNWGQRASYMANGAALENFCLAASERGAACDVRYFPSTDITHIATIAISGQALPDPLAAFIEARTSNRKAYAADPLSDSESMRLKNAAPGFMGEITLVDDSATLKTLGNIGAVNEEVMLTHKAIHHFFFSHINWTKEEDDKNSIGFYIETLELPPPARAGFRLLRAWSRARCMTALGMHKMVRSQNGATNAAAAAFGALSIPSLEPRAFVDAGRALERVWLTAAASGLSLQPLTGVLFFRLLIQGGDDGTFSAAQRALITDSYDTAKAAFGIHGNLVFMFRVGRAEAPTARASRLPFASSVEEK
ncbi:hypothetical protein K8R03_04035 [Candidatus Kaiserbacteria bacterium]|nr:hypothetical protein [Candidatus Kaiserbacteria bacterium]